MGHPECANVASVAITRPIGANWDVAMSGLALPGGPIDHYGLMRRGTEGLKSVMRITLLLHSHGRCSRGDIPSRDLTLLTSVDAKERYNGP